VRPIPCPNGGEQQPNFASRARVRRVPHSFVDKRPKSYGVLRGTSWSFVDSLVRKGPVRAHVFGTLMHNWSAEQIHALRSSNATMYLPHWLAELRSVGILMRLHHLRGLAQAHGWSENDRCIRQLEADVCMPDVLSPKKQLFTRYVPPQIPTTLVAIKYIANENSPRYRRSNMLIRRFLLLTINFKGSLQPPHQTPMSDSSTQYDICRYIQAPRSFLYLRDN